MSQMHRGIRDSDRESKLNGVPSPPPTKVVSQSDPRSVLPSESVIDAKLEEVAPSIDAKSETAVVNGALSKEGQGENLPNAIKSSETAVNEAKEEKSDPSTGAASGKQAINDVVYEDDLDENLPNAIKSSETAVNEAKEEKSDPSTGAASGKQAINDVVYEDDLDEDSPYAMKNLSDAINEIEAAGNSIQKAHRTLKVAMFAWESLHSVAVGGVAAHLTELAAGLERRGHEVHVYVRSGEGQISYERIHGVHVHRVCFDLSPDLVQEVQNMCNAMVHFMTETEAYMCSTFDVCHAHDWLAAAALINIKHNLGRKCVFTLHSTEYGRCGNNTYGGQSARIRGLEQEAVYLADRVIGVSGVLCDEIKTQYSFEWDKLRCVHNGINCLRYDGNLWDPYEVRAKYGVGAMDPMVLFVGRMASQKGPDLLVDAIPAILRARADAKFVMVGDGYMKQGLINRAHELRVAGSVCFTGALSGQELVDLFKATDIVAIPSRNEPFGIVVLEAWASNKPVVVTKSGGPREFVWHNNDGYLVDTSVDGIAWGICNCFLSFDHARYMGGRGRVKAAFQFSWDKIAELTNNIYDELFGMFPPPPPPEETPVDDGAKLKEDATSVDDLAESKVPVISGYAML